MKKIKISKNSNSINISTEISRLEIKKVSNKIIYSIYTEDLHLKDVSSALLFEINSQIVSLLPIINDNKELSATISNFSDKIGNGTKIELKCYFSREERDNNIEIPCSWVFKFYSEIENSIYISSYPFISIQILIEFIPKQYQGYKLFGYAPLYSKIGHLKLNKDFSLFDSKNITFYSNSWQSWSINRLLKHGDKWASCPVKLGRTVLENQDKKLEGRYQSEWHSVITDVFSQSSLILGFITLKDQFSRVLMDQIKEKGQISWLCAYSQTDSIPLNKLNESLKKSEILMISLVTNPEGYEILSEICRFGGLIEKAKISNEIIAGFCSWYYYYTKITEDDMIKNLEFFKRNRDIPINLIQLDDGYQTHISDWGMDNEKFNEKFPHGLKWLVEKIHSANFDAGLWVAPFFIAEGSNLLKEHPEWVLKDGSGKKINTEKNWGHDNYAIDLSRDNTIKHLEKLTKIISHKWKFDFLKIDFIYASEVLGSIYKNPSYSRAQILRRGVQAIRNGLGENKTLLGCGAPLGPCVGLVDVMRIGPDTKENWTNYDWLFTKIGKVALPSLKSALYSTIQRSYMHNRWFVNDPDCVIVRKNKSKLNLDEIKLQLTVFGLSGGQVLISDDENLVSKERIELLKRILPPYTTKLSPQYSFESIPLDIFSKSVPTLYAKTIETPFGIRYLVSIINWERKKINRTVKISDLISYRIRIGYNKNKNKNKNKNQKFFVFDYWNEKIIAIKKIDEKFEISDIPTHGCSFLSIIPIIPINSGKNKNFPLFISSTLHMTIFHNLIFFPKSFI